MPLGAQSTTRVKPFICTMPMRLDEGWNQIQVRRAHGAPAQRAAPGAGSRPDHARGRPPSPQQRTLTNTPPPASSFLCARYESGPTRELGFD